MWQSGQGLKIKIIYRTISKAQRLSYQYFQSLRSFQCQQSFRRWESWWSWEGWRGRGRWRWDRAGCLGWRWQWLQGTCWRFLECDMKRRCLSRTHLLEQCHPQTQQRYWCCCQEDLGRTEQEKEMLTYFFLKFNIPLSMKGHSCMMENVSWISDSHRRTAGHHSSWDPPGPGDCSGGRHPSCSTNKLT